MLHFALLHCKYQIQLSGAKEKADVLTTLTLVIFQSGPIQQIIVLPSNDVRRKPFQSALSRIHFNHLRFALRQHPSDAVGEVFSVESFGDVAGALVFNDVGQSAGVEGDHRSGAGADLGYSFAECFLWRPAQKSIGCALNITDTEVAVQVAVVLDSEALTY